MPSEKKIAANRRNAQKSTGPKTLSGKTIASMNALKHGLCARKPIVTGERLVDATAAIDPLTNGPIVRFELDRQGGRIFGAETGKHVGDFMAILLDGRVQGRPPVIQSRIERSGQITMGNRSLQEAQDLALTLRAGALPG